MEAVVSIVLILVVIVLFELAAQIWGTDSRERVGDDHQRSLRGGA